MARNDRGGRGAYAGWRSMLVEGADWIAASFALLAMTKMRWDEILALVVLRVFF